LWITPRCAARITNWRHGLQNFGGDIRIARGDRFPRPCARRCAAGWRRGAVHRGAASYLSNGLLGRTRNWPFFLFLKACGGRRHRPPGKKAAAKTRATEGGYIVARPGLFRSTNKMLRSPFRPPFVSIAMAEVAPPPTAWADSRTRFSSRRRLGPLWNHYSKTCASTSSTGRAQK